MIYSNILSFEEMFYREGLYWLPDEMPTWIISELRLMLDKKVTVSELKERVDRFISEREWNKYHKPKDLSISIVLESSELLEHFQWLSDNEIEIMLKDSQKLQIESELADIIIYCLSLSNVLKTDLSDAVLRKIEEDEKKYPSEKIKGSYRKYNQIGSQK